MPQQLGSVKPRLAPGSGPRSDIRLVPAAALGWVTAWAAPLLPAAVLVALAGIAIVVAAGCLASTESVRASGRLRWPAAAAVALSGVALIAGTSAVHVYARDESPLRIPAQQGEELQLRVRVSEAVRPLSSGATGSRVLVVAEAVAATCDTSCGPRSPRPRWLSGSLLIFAPAEGWAQLSPGSLVTAEVTLAPASPQDMLLAIAFARGPPGATVAPTGVLDSTAAGIRSGLVERANRVLGIDEAGLLRGIVLGDTSGMDAILTENFRISGLSHLTAVSGMNCAIVVGIVLWPLRRSRLRGRTRAGLAGLALAGFVVLVGPQPSVLRAAVMGAVSLLALASGRSREAVPALAGTVLFLLAIDPGLARELGFALSVAATAGIVVFARRWAQQLRARGWPQPLAAAIAVGAAAGLCTAPLLLLIVARVSLISLPANLLVAPVVAAVTVFGLSAAVVAPVSPWLAEVLLRVTDLPLRWMVWIAERAARTPAAVMPWPGGPAGAIALVVVLVVAIRLLRRRRTRWLVAAACVGIVTAGVSVRVLAPTWPPTGWTFVACDVGQGDALVFALEPGRALVIDTGPDPVLVDGCLRRLGVIEVPLLVLSHLHADHIDGLAGVLHGRTVGAVATSLDPVPVEAYSRIRGSTEAAGIPLVTVTPGQSLAVGPATVEVLGPVARYVGTRSDPNNSSIVARITLGEVSILATGDVETEAQRDLLRRGTDLHADVLKVPHHGSAYQEPAFLAATGARQAVISVGAGNDYGHPDQVLVDRLTASGMTVHRTDQDGDVAVVSGSGALTVVGRGDAVRARVSAAPGLPVVDRISARPRHGPSRSRPRVSRRVLDTNRRSRPQPVAPRRAGRPARPRGSRPPRPRLPGRLPAGAPSRGEPADSRSVHPRSARP